MTERQGRPRGRGPTQARAADSLTEVFEAWPASDDPTEVYRALAEAIRPQVPFDMLDVTVVEPGSDTGTLEFAAGILLHGGRRGSAVPLKGTSARAALESARPVLLTLRSPEQVARQWPGLAGAYRRGLRSLMAVPMTVQGRTLGVLHLGCRRPRAYRRRHVALARRVAQQIASMLTSTRLHAAHLRLEAALRESEEKLRQMAENVGEVFWMTDGDGRQVLYISPRFEQVWGRSCSELCQCPDIWLQGVHPEDQEKALAAGFMAADRTRPTQTEYRILRPDGQVRWIRDRAVPLRDEAGRVYRVVGAAQDITEAKALEQRLLHSQKLEAVGRLAGGVAHDFNNLLTAVTGYTQMAAGRLGDDHETADFLREVLKAVQRAADLTRKLLAFSRAAKYEPKVVDLNTHITDMVGLIERFTSDDITFSVNLAPGVGHVYLDPTQLEQVVVNLVVNACDAMPQGGHLTVETYAAPPGEPQEGEGAPFVVLAVSDTGVGMSQEVLDKAFEPFFTTKGASHGTGLGLSTCYGLIQEWGGHIRVESQQGRGSVFRVFLPAAEARPMADMGDGMAEPAGGHEAILLVEDNGAVREMAAMVLREKGYDVAEASDGLQALEIIRDRRRPLDLVVTDVVLPEMDGLLLAQEVAVARPGVRVLLTSGHIEGHAMLPGVEASGVSFLPKPFSPRVLLTKVREVLDSDQGLPRHREATESRPR